MENTVELIRQARVPRVLQATTVSPVTDPRGSSPPCVEYGMDFHNYLPSTVYVIDRTGIVLKVPRRGHNPLKKTGIDFVKRWAFDNAVNFDHGGLLGVATGQEYESIRDAFISQQNRKHAVERNRVDVVYHVSEVDFNSAGRSMYFPTVDLVVTVEDPAQYYCHPGSQAMLRASHLSREVFSTYWQIAVVDNRAQYTKLFVNLNGEVYEVIPERNHSLSQGVYTYTRNKVEDSTSNIQCRYYTFENAFKELPLFASAKEAHDHGNLETRLDADLEMRKNNLKIALVEQEALVKKLALDGHQAKHALEVALSKMKEDAERAKLEMDAYERKVQQEENLRKLEYQRELDTMKQRNADMDARLARDKADRDAELSILKDRLERASSVRKDTSDFAKNLPIIFGGLVAAAAVYSKLGVI